MRRIRDEAGISLRELENRGSWRRSTISQVETGRARPSRRLVEWYDTELGTDGLLLSIYAEARTGQLPVAEPSSAGVAAATPVGDSSPAGVVPPEVRVVEVDPPAGLLVATSERLQARVTLANAGALPWRGLRLRRVGAYGGIRLIGSAPRVDVPDARPGRQVDVLLDLRAPELPGTAIAYWEVQAPDGLGCTLPGFPIAVLLVVE